MSILKNRFCMQEQYSNQLPDISSEMQVNSIVETSQIDPKKNARAKENTSIIIGWILRGGVVLSATVILTGMLLLLLHPAGISGSGMSLGTFPHTLGQVWSGLLALRPQAVIALGLLLLIATPVITVTTSAVAFAVERDRRFMIIALIVLAILIASLLIGKGGG
jgi:uncharacterized membrane protein